MAGAWTTSEYERLFRDHPPTKPHAPGGDDLAALAWEFGRSTGAVNGQWQDARSAILNNKTAASSPLLGYLRGRGWLEVDLTAPAGRGGAMTEDTQTAKTSTAWSCPKDGTAMQPMGRRSGTYRCPECRGIFIDTEAMRRGRGGRPPKWLPVVTSALFSLLVTFVVRRLRRRPPQQTPS